MMFIACDTPAYSASFPFRMPNVKIDDAVQLCSFVFQQTCTNNKIYSRIDDICRGTSVQHPKRIDHVWIFIENQAKRSAGMTAHLPQRRSRRRLWQLLVLLHHRQSGANKVPEWDRPGYPPGLGLGDDRPSQQMPSQV